MRLLFEEIRTLIEENTREELWNTWLTTTKRAILILYQTLRTSTKPSFYKLIRMYFHGLVPR